MFNQLYENLRQFIDHKLKPYSFQNTKQVELILINCI